MTNSSHYEEPLYKVNEKGGAMVGKTKVMLNLFNYLDILADLPTTVLLYGETGTGKELCAKALHYNSSIQKKGRFVAVNCDSFNSELLESELFGHVRGAFTGAMKDYEGKFLCAGEGTIFLDEIGEISKPTQSKLLRVLQEKHIMPVGSNDYKKIDVRIIAATNRNLEEEVKKGNFREDLYYRLNVVPIKIPSLRERQDDIPLITKYLIKEFNSEYGAGVEGIDNLAEEMLKLQDWKGNIRELRNIIERVFLFKKEGIIKKEDLLFGSDIPDIESINDRTKVSEIVNIFFEESGNQGFNDFDTKLAKKIRKEKGMSLQKLADHIGITKGGSVQVGSFEKGKFRQDNPRGNAIKYLEWLAPRGYDYLSQIGKIPQSV